MNEDLRGILAREVAAVDIILTDDQAGALLRHLELIARWRTRARLTAVTDPAEAARVHVADSLLCLRAGMPPRAMLIDVGSGAGFPGIPLVIVRPDLRVILLEAASRKAAFLERAVAELGLRARVVRSRAEDAGRESQWREGFDVAVARAVAPLATLCELVLPLVRVGGKAVLLKGPSVRAEVAAGRRVARMLGGGELEIADAHLSGGEHRVLVTIGKREVTPAEFPRRTGLPRRKPL